MSELDVGRYLSVTLEFGGDQPVSIRYGDDKDREEERLDIIAGTGSSVVIFGDEIRRLRDALNVVLDDEATR